MVLGRQYETPKGTAQADAEYRKMVVDNKIEQLNRRLDTMTAGAKDLSDCVQAIIKINKHIPVSGKTVDELIAAAVLQMDSYGTRIEDIRKELKELEDVNGE